jgi:hypothetical protein
MKPKAARCSAALHTQQDNNMLMLHSFEHYSTPIPWPDMCAAGQQPFCHCLWARLGPCDYPMTVVSLLTANAGLDLQEDPWIAKMRITCHNIGDELDCDVYALARVVFVSM